MTAKADDWIVQPFSRPHSPVLQPDGCACLYCETCDNDDQDRFLLVTSLSGDTLRGYVCEICELKARGAPPKLPQETKP